jgi:hypothetical protein
MMHLAKCAPTQYEVDNFPKLTGAKGIEFILMPRHLTPEKLSDSVKAVEYASQLPTIEALGVEINEGIPNGYPGLEGLKLINPISTDETVKRKSQDYITKMAEAFTTPIKNSGKRGYFQFQAVGDVQEPDKPPAVVDKPKLTKELDDFAKYLKDKTGIEIMLEDQNRVCLCATAPDVVYNTKVGCNPNDWNSLSMPMLLDVAHLSLDNYTIAQKLLYPDGVQTSKGKYLVEATDEEVKEIGEKLAPYIQKKDSDGVRKTMTDIVTGQMRKHKSKIGGLHINNAGFVGVEVDAHDEGWSDNKGAMDLGEIIRTAVEIDPRYIVVEVKENDFRNPVNQVAMSNAIRAIEADVKAKKK